MTNDNTFNLEHVASLARLRLNPEEIVSLQEDFNSILNFVAELNAADISGVNPTARANGIENALREDVACEKGLQEAVLNNAPARFNDTLIQVPAVLPGEGMA